MNTEKIIIIIKLFNCKNLPLINIPTTILTGLRTRI